MNIGSCFHHYSYRTNNREWFHY